MAKKIHQIQCAVCGSDHHTHYKNTTHCNVCRALRDMSFIGSKTAKCFVCKDEFAPLNRNDEMCSKCDYHHAIYGKGTCAFCKAEGATLMRHDIAICVGCSRDPKRRSKILESLRKKQQLLMDSPVRLDAPAPEPERRDDLDDVPEV